MSSKNFTESTRCNDYVSCISLALISSRLVLRLSAIEILLPTSRPSKDARLVRWQHYKAVRKYCAGGKNLD